MSKNIFFTIFREPLIKFKIISRIINLFQNPIKFIFRYYIKKQYNMPLLLRNNKKINITEKDTFFLNWFLRTGCRIDVTEDGEFLLYYKGMKLLIRPGGEQFFVFYEIFLKDTYKLSSLSYERYENIIDIGAHVGYFTCAMLNKSNKVISIEPVDDNYRQAVKNVLLNGGNLSNILNYAVVGKETDKKIKIYVDKTAKARSSISDIVIKELNNVELVNCISLHKIFIDYNLSSVDLVKCDAEAAEYDIFLNTPFEILKTIKKIVMEIHINEKWPINYAEDLIKYFNDAGFKVDCDLPKNDINKARDFTTILVAVQNGEIN